MDAQPTRSARQPLLHPVAVTLAAMSRLPASSTTAPPALTGQFALGAPFPQKPELVPPGQLPHVTLAGAFRCLGSSVLTDRTAGSLPSWESTAAGKQRQQADEPSAPLRSPTRALMFTQEPAPAQPGVAYDAGGDGTAGTGPLFATIGSPSTSKHLLMIDVGTGAAPVSLEGIEWRVSLWHVGVPDGAGTEQRLSSEWHVTESSARAGRAHADVTELISRHHATTSALQFELRVEGWRSMGAGGHATAMVRGTAQFTMAWDEAAPVESATAHLPTMDSMRLQAQLSGGAVTELEAAAREVSREVVACRKKEGMTTLCK